VATKVKICGLTNLEDATRAADLGAWALGLIFHDASPRRCDTADAVEIAAALRRRAMVCGVFVNRPLYDVAAAADEIGLTMLQFHGDEGPAYCAEAARRTGCQVVKAAQVRTRADLQALASFHTDLHLLDAHAPGLRGGTGETFDWELLRDRQARVPVILSGGLTPQNVADGIAVAHPFAVDVASGVEAEVGRKDPAKLEAFFAAARSAPHGGVGPIESTTLKGSDPEDAP
jgi:phosphoribosylanthranilate isomerase